MVSIPTGYVIACALMLVASVIFMFEKFARLKDIERHFCKLRHTCGTCQIERRLMPGEWIPGCDQHIYCCQRCYEAGTRSR